MARAIGSYPIGREFESLRRYHLCNLKEPNLDESFDVKVIGLLRYNNFHEMFNDFDISILADKETSKEKLINDLEKFYTKEKQEQYGVLGIRIELI